MISKPGVSPSLNLLVVNLLFVAALLGWAIYEWQSGSWIPVILVTLVIMIGDTLLFRPMRWGRQEEEHARSPDHLSAKEFLVQLSLLDDEGWRNVRRRYKYAEDGEESTWKTFSQARRVARELQESDKEMKYWESPEDLFGYIDNLVTEEVIPYREPPHEYRAVRDAVFALYYKDRLSHDEFDLLYSPFRPVRTLVVIDS